MALNYWGIGIFLSSNSQQSGFLRRGSVLLNGCLLLYKIQGVLKLVWVFSNRCLLYHPFLDALSVENFSNRKACVMQLCLGSTWPNSRSAKTLTANAGRLWPIWSKCAPAAKTAGTVAWGTPVRPWWGSSSTAPRTQFRGTNWSGSWVSGRGIAARRIFRAFIPELGLIWIGSSTTSNLNNYHYFVYNHF